MATNHYVTNFYKFTYIEDPIAFCAELKVFAKGQGLTGLVIVAPEGLNGTLVARTPEIRAEARQWLKDQVKFEDGDFKDSMSQRRPFPKFKTKVRKEIVTLNTPELFPESHDPSYLSPEAWNKWLKGSRKFNLVDARNAYEFRIGAFRGATDSGTRMFTQLPDVIESKLELNKDEPLLMYCTGGIRCEKAVLEMRRRGYREVYQLHGGILKYLETFPNDQFEGECFVFDDRVAVDQSLGTTKNYSLCPHCGDPANVPIECERCSHKGQVCGQCAEKPILNQTCSRDCAHHFKLRPHKKLRRPRPSRYA
jgi:UPF0176 protein